MSLRELEIGGGGKKRGFMYTTFVVEGDKYLPHLTRVLTMLGGELMEKRVDSIQSLLDTLEGNG